MPTRFLLWIFVAAFVYYLLFGVRRGLRPARTARVRYWIFLVVFVLFLFLLIRLV